MSINLRKAVFSWLAVIISFSLYAQKTGTILGSVKDKNTQEGLVGATILVEGTTLGTTADVEGNFKLSNVPVGPHNIKAQIVGYRSETKFNIVVSSGNDQTVNFELTSSDTELQEVQVKVDKGRTAIITDMATPLSIQRLTTEEIKANPGGNFDISRVIQVLPGVGGGTSVNRNDIIVRGGAPNENVYYLDGIEIPVLNHFQTQGASGGATGILNVSFIDDVQLSSSAFDARFDNALASTFNIKQRNGNPEKLGGNIRLSGTELATTFEGPISPKTTFLASARRSYLQLLFKALDLPIRPDYWDFQYKVLHKINSKTTLNFIGVGAIDKFRLSTPKNATLENEYILRSNPKIDQWNYTVGVSMKKLIEDGYWNLAVSRNMYDNRADKFQDNVEKEEFRTLGINSQEIENKIRFDVNKFVNGWKYSYGVMGQYVKYNAAIFNQISNELKDETGKILIPKVAIRFNSAIDFFKYGAFGQVSKRFLNERLLLSAGVRSDMNSFTTDGKNPLKTLSPRLSVLYNITPKFDITASIGRYFKIPVYTNLGYRNEAGVLQNQSMKYIQSNHYVAGFQFIPREDLRLTLEGFYKTYQNYPVSALTGISLANQGTEFTSVGNERFVSAGKGETYGAEFFIQQKLINKVFYALSLTAFRSQFSGMNGVLKPSSWDFGYLLSTTIGRKFKRNWEMGLKYRLAGGQPYTPFDPTASRLNYLLTGVGTLNYAAINTQRLKPFNQFDFRLDKKYNFKKTSLDLYIDVQNALLFNTPALSSYTFKRKADNSGFETTDGKAIRLDGSNAIPVILENNDPTVVPTIGFIFEF